MAAAALAWFVLPPLAGGLVASGLALIAAAIVLFALVGRAQAHHLAAPLAGAVACVVAFVSPAAWLVTSFTLAAVLVVAELVGVARVARGRDAAWLLGVAIGIPVAFGCAIAMAGAGEVLVGTLRAAAPVSPLETAALTVCRALIAVVLLRPAALRARLGVVLGAATFVLLAVRVANVAALVRIDAELFWPECPMLINALKLENHEALYGAPAALDSYSYSPLLDVTHRMLLRPLGLQLDLHAHRVIILGDQIAAFAVMVWALWPRLRTLPWAGRVAGACVLAFASLSNLLAPAVHPDHPLLLCFAIAVALTVAPERMPPRVRDVALLMLTPVATGFKLSGAGIGAALAIVAIARRDRRSLKLLVASGALTIATIPLFDALFGRFSFYAIAVQRSHPMDWSRLLQTPYVWFFAYAAGGAAAFMLARRMVAPAERGGALSLLVLAMVILLFSLPATAKYAGRDNNLTLSFVATTALLVLLATQAPKFAGALIAFAIWGSLHTRPPSKPIDRKSVV